MTEIQVEDADYRLSPGVWQGLLLTASKRRPGLEIQACSPHCIRLAVNRRPVLWTRVEEDYYGYDLLRARTAPSLGILPPLHFSLVEQNAHSDRTQSLRAWARSFATQLNEPTASPLEAGRWFLGKLGDALEASELRPELVEQIVQQRSIGYVSWDIGDKIYPITLRDRSDPETGRVKAWRKHARAGTLPPVLLYWVSGLQADVVLDGHDRLLAASLDRVPAPALRLAAIGDREEPPDAGVAEAVLERVSRSLSAAEREAKRPPSEQTARALRLMDVDTANRLVLDAFAPRRRHGRTRARPVRGGLAQWVSEVQSELAAQGIGDSGLLEGLGSFLGTR